MLLGDIYCCWAGSWNFTPCRALTIAEARGMGLLCMLFAPQHRGESSLSSSPGFSCGLQHGVQPDGAPRSRRGPWAAHPAGTAEGGGCVQGHSARCPSLGDGMKAPDPSRCRGWVGGRVWCSSWGSPAWPRGACRRVASSRAIRPVPSANKCSPLFQAVELTAFKSSGNICLHHFFAFRYRWEWFLWLHAGVLPRGQGIFFAQALGIVLFPNCPDGCSPGQAVGRPMSPLSRWGTGGCNAPAALPGSTGGSAEGAPLTAPNWFLPTAPHLWGCPSMPAACSTPAPQAPPTVARLRVAGLGRQQRGRGGTCGSPMLSALPVHPSTAGPWGTAGTGTPHCWARPGCFQG